MITLSRKDRRAYASPAKARAVGNKLAERTCIRAAERRIYLEAVRQPWNARKRLLHFLTTVGVGRGGGFSAATWRVNLGSGMETVLETARSKTGRTVLLCQVPKNILVKTKVGGRTRHALLVLPWDAKFDETKVKAALRADESKKNKVSLAGKEDVERLTGYPVGHVSPLPLAETPLTVLIDPSVMLREERSQRFQPVFIPFGEPGLKLRLRADALVRAIKTTGVHPHKIISIMQ